MRPPFWDRVKEWVCQRFGHKERYSENSRAFYCARCLLLLKGPLDLMKEER